MKTESKWLLVGVVGLILRGMLTNKKINMGPGWVWPVPALNVETQAGVMSQYPAVITQEMHSKHPGVDIMYARKYEIDRTKWPTGEVDAGGAKQHAKFFAPIDTPVLAVQEGQVRLVKDIPQYGTWIMIDHGTEFTSSYFHLRNPIVKPGQYVRAGDRIATMGHAEADGEKLRHLHFELWSRQAGGRIDPALGLNGWDGSASWTV